MSESTRSACRWGILGAAFIARKNWQAIRDAGNAVLVAVASRDASRAEAFVDECQAQVPHAARPEALAGYEALLARADIDAVYVPLPTGLRTEWVLRAVEAGKHVLVEKPVGCSAEQVERIVAACDRRGLQFMDGVMFMHGRRLRQMRGVLDAEVAPVRHVASQFSFLAGPGFEQTNIRAHGRLEPLGCLGDLGWYCLRFSLWAMGEAEPVRAAGRIHAETPGSADSPPVPIAFSGALEFAGGGSASYFCAFNAANAQWAVVSGERGLLQLSDFVLPFSGRELEFSVTHSDFAVDGCRADMHAGRRMERVAEPSNNAPGSQESALFEDFSRLVLGGSPDRSWGRISLLTQRALDACLRSARTGGGPVPLTP